MWVLLSRRLRMWLLASVAVPTAGWVLGKAGRQLEQRRGRSRTSRLLVASGERFGRGRRA